MQVTDGPFKGMMTYDIYYIENLYWNIDYCFSHYNWLYDSGISGDIMQYTCPLCNQYPVMVLGDTAFCDSDNCKVISWDWKKSLDELLMDVGIMDLNQGKE